MGFDRLILAKGFPRFKFTQQSFIDANAQPLIGDPRHWRASTVGSS